MEGAGAGPTGMPAAPVGAAVVAGGVEPSNPEYSCAGVVFPPHPASKVAVATSQVAVVEAIQVRAIMTGVYSSGPGLGEIPSSNCCSAPMTLPVSPACFIAETKSPLRTIRLTIARSER